MTSRAASRWAAVAAATALWIVPLPIHRVAALAVLVLLCAGLLGRPGRRAWSLAGMGAAFATMNVGHGFIRRLLRPQYLWVAYPGTERDKRHYFPKWVERLVRPLYSLGLMRFGRYWGLMVAGKATAESLDGSPERLRQMLDEARDAYPGVQVIALAGRLPSMAIKAGIPLETPFTTGDKGTLCTMMMTAREQASLLGKAPHETVIAVVGGAGFVGRRLTAELGHEFHRVICLDPRFTEQETRANVLYTGAPADISSAEAVLVLTSRGDQAESVIPFLTPGTVVADDTHPEISGRVRSGMESSGAQVFKATMGDARFRIMPRVPFFRADDIPGCVLEALVVLERGRGVLSSQATFNAAASGLGFGARLARHMSSV
ncbi:MAG: NAD-dependent epimerase/dehydratase family protein [Actinomycetota bacterium]|nr:NAD-dependent epimerase/dehydratase family protein [Actinomycetota bacterium]